MKADSMRADYSDYIVYVDESGDHGLKSIDPQYPETFAKSHLFAPSVVRKCSFTIEYAAFAAELKNKYAVFCTRSRVMQNSQNDKGSLHAASSYTKLSYQNNVSHSLF